MAKTSFRIEGLRELNERLKQLDQQVQKEALEKAVDAGAQIIAKDAARRAPRSDVPRRPADGHLADNIIISVRSKGKSANALVGPSKKHFWGLFLEYGTVRAPKRPFLRPAFDENIPRLIDEMKSVLREALEKGDV